MKTEWTFPPGLHHFTKLIKANHSNIKLLFSWIWKSCSRTCIGCGENVQRMPIYSERVHIFGSKSRWYVKEILNPFDICIALSPQDIRVRCFDCFVLCGMNHLLHHHHHSSVPSPITIIITIPITPFTMAFESLRNSIEVRVTSWLAV